MQLVAYDSFRKPKQRTWLLKLMEDSLCDLCVEDNLSAAFCFPGTLLLAHQSRQSTSLRQHRSIENLLFDTVD